MFRRIRAAVRVPDFNNPGIWKRDYRVAVTGFSRAGKTVFLTSLAAHLLNHDPQRFHMGRGIEIVSPHILSPHRGWEEFPYHDNRTALSGEAPGWPEKTRSATQLRIEFQLSHWRVKKIHLTLYDLPGERFADCTMHRSRFESWSNDQLQWLGGLGERPPEVDDFLRLVNRANARRHSPEEIVFSYKKALAALYAGYHKFIAPSTFVLDTEGSHLYEDHTASSQQADLDAIAQRRVGILDEGRRRLLAIATDKIGFLDTHGNSWINDTYYSLDTTDDFHTYRVIKDSETVDVFVDVFDSPVLSFAYTDLYPNSAPVQVILTVTSGQGVADYDVRSFGFNSDGTELPTGIVPEPSAYVLWLGLCLTGLGIYGWRRRELCEQ